jgi:heptose-I-phosphate ethanolaminephosphotransferase
LAGLRYDKFEPDKSLINPAFKTGKRWIGNPEAKLRDFDTL